MITVAFKANISGIKRCLLLTEAVRKSQQSFYSSWQTVISSHLLMLATAELFLKSAPKQRKLNIFLKCAWKCVSVKLILLHNVCFDKISFQHLGMLVSRLTHFIGFHIIPWPIFTPFVHSLILTCWRSDTNFSGYYCMMYSISYKPCNRATLIISIQN